jgi:hypothetical protein
MAADQRAGALEDIGSPLKRLGGLSIGIEPAALAR